MQQSCTTSHRNRPQSLKSKQQQEQQGTGRQSWEQKHAVDSWQPLRGPLQVSKNWMKTNPSGKAIGCESPSLLQGRVNSYGFLAAVFDSVCSGRGLDRELTKHFSCLSCRLQIRDLYSGRSEIADFKSQMVKLRFQISHSRRSTPQLGRQHRFCHWTLGSMPTRSYCLFTELLIH